MFERSTLRLSSLSLVAAAAVTVASLAISGCATGIIADPSNVTSAQAGAFSGSVYGGATPISGATVSIWETDPNSTGYPSASVEKAKLLQSTTTTSTGSFSFAGGYTCDAPATGTAGPFLYLTSTGGNTGSNSTANNNSVLVAALGNCSYILSNISNVKVKVNEATTVAAAYALGNFMYVDNTTPGLQSVYIGAPVKNNAVTGTCTGTGSAMTCTAAGLSHAFNNAFNLADAIHFDGTSPGGSARTAVPVNPIIGQTTGNVDSIVPQAELHTLANILQSCVNSTGGSGSGGNPNAVPPTTTGTDGTTCGNLFALATSASGATPTDVTTAAINIAQNPTHNLAGLFALVPGTAFFQPTLTAAPHDFSVAIIYPGYQVGTGGVTFGQPQSVALDPNDDVYVSANAPATNPTSGSVTSLTSNGVLNWTTGANSTICAPFTAATDTVGNVWVANYTSSTVCTGGVNGIYSIPQASSGTAVALGNSFTNASTANIQGNAFGLGIDRGNNLWYGRKLSTCQTSAGAGANTASVCVAEIPYNGGAYGAATNLQTFLTGTNINGTTLNNDTNIVVDAKQNIWIGGYESGGTSTDTPIGVIPNTGTVDAPAYSGASTPATTGEAFGMLAIDGSGNAWTGVASNVFSYTLTGSTLSAPSGASTSVTASKPQSGEWDGGGKVFFTSSSNSGQIWFYNPTLLAAGATASLYAGNLVPCYLPSTSSTTCLASAGTNASQYPRNVQIDSTGSIWVSAPLSAFAAPAATSGFVLQVIGTAAPVWPQLSYAVFGTKPQ